MVPSFRIRNFRVFDEIDIDRLARVNLVVGKNNAGKTCLLEALRVHGDSASRKCLASILRGRAEDRAAQFLEAGDGASSGDDRLGDPVGSLFHGYRLPFDGTAIELGPCESDEVKTDAYSLRLAVAAYRVEREGEERIERRVEPNEAEEDDDIRLVVERRNSTADWTTVRRRLLSRGRSTHAGGALRGDTESLSVPFVGANSNDEEQALDHWRRIAVRPSARAIVEDALRIIDPSILEVVVLPSSDRHRSGEVVLIYSETKRLPLRSLGDGIQRLFQIMLAVITGAGGLVLIDEFENGLHWSVQRTAWALLFKLAGDLDVQLVATTHSWDCISAFRDAMSAREDSDGQLLHLGRSVRTSNHGAFISTAYDKEALTRVTQGGLEVR